MSPEIYLYKKFKKNLSLNDFPEIKKQALDAIQEFKTGVPIRDVEIDIHGYK